LAISSHRIRCQRKREGAGIWERRADLFPQNGKKTVLIWAAMVYSLRLLCAFLA
jgi:hypothetical protein